MTVTTPPGIDFGESDPRLDAAAREVRERRIADNLDLASYIAGRFAGRGEPLEDLRQVAYLALVVAADRFDPELGVAFATFASSTIVGGLKHHFRDHGWTVRVPRALQEMSAEVRAQVDLLTHRLGRPPTVREIAGACGRREDEVLQALEASQAYRTSSLDAPGIDADALHGGDDFASLELHDELWSYVGRLGARDRLLLRLRYVDELNQSEIASRTGLSQVHVSRLLRHALDELRALYASELAEPGSSVDESASFHEDLG
jgi:RNA polymerase sigma-B factor